jgi:dipeptidyl aminopeptidase/acylaminoacyl peptidase
MRAGLFGARGFVSLTFVLAAPALATLGAQQVAAQAESASNVNANAKSTKLTLESYFDLEDVQDPQLSPDGKQIIYTRRWVDKLNDRWETSLWIMNADGTRPRFLINGSNARWSPDGSRLAYFAKGEPAGTQLFVRYMDAEGSITQLTRVGETPSDLEWSPDGKQIAFRMLVPLRNNWKVDMPEAPKGAKWTEAPRIVERLTYRRDRQGFIDDGYRHLFVVPSDGGTARQVTSGNFEHGPARWMPSGQTLVFSALRVEDADYRWRESEIYAADVASGAVRQLTRRPGPDGDAVPSPDGRLIAYAGYDSTSDTFVERKLYVMNADGSSARVLTAAFDRSPSGLQWAPDNSGIYFNAESEGSRNLYFAPVGGGAVRPVTTGKQVLTVTDVSRGGLAVGVRSTATEPNDVVAFDLKTPRQVRKLTAVNEDVLAGKRLGETEEIWYTSVDGFRIQGWLVKPPGFDARRKYPLMLDIHGGPHAMYNVGFSFARQEHAGNDYVVLYTNPRGSSGYGSAFGNAIKNAYPGKDFDDLMAGVDTVIGRGFIDDRSLFVYGCSGGGVLTSWIVGHTDRFAAASANCPVTNWLSFVGTTDGAGWYYNFAKLPWEDPTEHLKRSPLMYVGNVKTPTMLMTGVMDLRTPMTQTEEYYQALKLRKVPTAMIRFNEEWHGTSSKPSNFLRTQLYLRSWFEKHGKRATVAASD